MAQYMSVNIFFCRLWAPQAHLWSCVISRMTVLSSIYSSAVSLQHFVFRSLFSSSSVLSYAVRLFSTAKPRCIYKGFRKRFGQEWLWVWEKRGYKRNWNMQLQLIWGHAWQNVLPGVLSSQKAFYHMFPCHAHFTASELEFFSILLIPNSGTDGVLALIQLGWLFCDTNTSAIHYPFRVSLTVPIQKGNIAISV